ncbi:HAD-IIIA family hydrolase [Desulfovibrio desulfuricans]|uniref:HAD-IIIA family hydrolase n=1 Tax=Desulfovibrio desulfuricans TaxID=876 RepID=UPI001D077CF5|nr:HAD-IIIA family hydrolase [Desulfovibrio desulfuricans]MCB6543276.1 HAD-IIIA family hydrolase [Desulfovibrio desulfuricans]MCB6554358.1 HAD-IIIA family hydrolase [Desulfovibrio desulfuricans]MCB6566215.1 HAD-IIIA family hydrolase [Desulfovibrio desulfuricans]MCB7347359.1 HAD-IIIA family hydrolase [Desulfovibrio desulfuricans]MCQ5217584.1 HAD-IIIA family hydrolase [Desulfovibrio desulfuricans]
MLHAVILAGGKGTRLADRLNGLPKPLVTIAGQPLLKRQMLALREHDIHSVTVLVNYKAEAIRDYLLDNGNFGMSVTLIDDGEPRGTAGAVMAALPSFPRDANDLLVLYGDTLFNIDLHRMVNFHNQHHGDATLFLHPNDHPYDSDLVECDGAARVRAIHAYPHPEDANYANLVNAALYIIRRRALGPWEHIAQEPPRVADFAKEIFPAMLQAGAHLCGYSSPEYIKDVGTPTRLDKAEADIASGRYAEGSLRTPKTAVFLDRDGVINREIGFLHSKEDFELLPGVGGALRRLNRSGLLSVVATNQPVIARGECSEEELAAIHARMDSLLGREGAYVDRLYYCPHHPHKGYAGERSELKIQCSCRKPGIGMLAQARKELHIDFSKSWMIGDRTGDILAAQNAGIRSILVQTGYAGKDKKFNVTADFVVADLEDAVSLILGQKQ